MAAYFYLILLSTSVLAEQNKEGPDASPGMGNALVTQLPEHFHWNRVGSQSVELGWDVEALGPLNADLVKLTARYYADPDNYRYAAISFWRGKLTLDGLKPETFYEMVLQPLKDNKPIYNHSSYLTTPKKGVGDAADAMGFTLVCVVSGLLLLAWQ
ncbi:hypothetical protein TcWFU_003984 [Taenia crassiceps]|uniref:Fibronectin type-III domain-containing protein n=1 Tax=Taenia crassiceps TaxID=6207 RepID=A0ABR4Q3M4_9CEST